MDYLTLLLLILSFIVSTFFFSFIQTSKHSKLPPGPKPYPIIGNILDLLNSSNSLKSFINLSKTYGPIITLKLGTLTSIVISSPQIAKEALQKNDVILSNRTIPYTMFSTIEEHCNKNSIIFLPSSTKWRLLRRACATRIFSPQQLDSTQILRKRKFQDLVNFLHQCCKKGEALDIGEAIFKTILNIISNTFISKDFVHYYDNDEKFKVFKDIVFGLTEESSRPCLGDFFPLLGFLGSHGARARTKDRYATLYAVFDGAMEERIRLRDSKIDSRECNDALDSLLDLVNEESSQLNRHDVVSLLMDLFVASIDTTSSTLEWAMAELIHSPKKLLKVREELEESLGKNGEVEESHISKLPYLNAIVKETLRLHPPAPFLVPHKANDDVELGGFTVPKSAQILINVWSIGRDSRVWANPNSFEPERFLDSEIDFKGKNFELIPFGSGRRICPGLSLASRTLNFMLASLLYHFNWKVANEMNPEDIDMSYSYGITLHKALPLFLVPIKV
ncbi:geraniol 8-hydroxylase [Arachis ipaensis]|uniref:Cytochrome P450 n=1 Tax=Arachis hypogaea TaxID=3818 RepID=A0A445E967_ARAHY|nr:geraniol 8-hydroxylase [Arachis ipaensis]XP_025634205.1 geraniol 8-hydroxylase [Arachis hypogaea]QHO25288.1 Cytochrome P450 [Arachis hypogaea]RYR71991.1 hypothetical protein Ahy_A02g006199 [Arachis hypogaea]